MKKSGTVTQPTRASIVAHVPVVILKKGLASVAMREVMAASARNYYLKLSCHGKREKTSMAELVHIPKINQGALPFR